MKNVVVIVFLFVIIILAIAPYSISHADKPPKNWEARLRYHDKKAIKMYKQIDLILRMVGEVMIEVKGYPAYRDLVLTPEEETNGKR